MPRPFTANDTPSRVARIRRDLETIQSTVRRGDRALRSLVLTGGFARGEGGMRGSRPQNDYDLVAVRGLGRPRVPYERMRGSLEDELGVHVDLAPVAAWRLRFVSPNIFWYETAHRGRVLWGAPVLGRIPVRRASQLDRTEGLRLLVNRAAGLLLATQTRDPDERRLQASKGLLAALDVHLLAAGRFPPSQRERWQAFESLRMAGRASPGGVSRADWWEWAIRFKLEPDEAPVRGDMQAWHQARLAILEAVPVALRQARLGSLEAYERRDGLLDFFVYVSRARRVPGARRWLRHPTGRVRVATLRLLEAAADGRVPEREAFRWMHDLVRRRHPSIPMLESLRGATLQ